jgi:hypothetical protein
MVHLDSVAANIYGSQERNIFRHFLECAALSALWSAATCRSFVSVKTCKRRVDSDVRLRRLAAADQSADKAAHSKKFKN